MAEGRQKVLHIPREGYSSGIEFMLTKEVEAMKRMLVFAGYKIKVAIATGSTVVSPIMDLKSDIYN